jgi:hypothetical protein
MLLTSKILFELISEYISNSTSSDEDYRLIVPGLTERIGQEIHAALIENEYSSYLVINDTRETNSAKKWLKPVSLTTMRIGSFIAVTDPGALADIRDSIRGSGGTVRSIAFSEEWPWIDDGNESFRFSSVFLNRLINHWTTDINDQKWLYDFIQDTLVGATHNVTNPSKTLLEEILGGFDPSRGDNSNSVRESFLFHCGIPRSENTDLTPQKFKKKIETTIRKIMDRSRVDHELRQQIVESILGEESTEGLLENALHSFFDGLANPSALTGSVLSFQRCWGDRQYSFWHLLSIEHLQNLFEFRDDVPLELECRIIDQDNLVISENKKAAACMASSDVSIRTAYNIPKEEYDGNNCTLQVSIRNSIISETPINTAIAHQDLILNIGDTGLSYRGRVPIRISLVINNQIRGEERVHLHCCGEMRPAFVVITPQFSVENAAEVAEDDPAPERRIYVDGTYKFSVLTILGSNPELQIEDEYEHLTQEDGIWHTQGSRNIFDAPNGQVVCRCQIDDLMLLLTLEAKDIDLGAYTLEDEFRNLITNGSVRRVGEILKIYSGETRELYPRLGGINDYTRRRKILSNLFEDTAGWKPVLANLIEFNSGSTEACGSYTRKLVGTSGASAFDHVELPDSVIPHVQEYSNARSNYRQVLRDLTDTSSDSYEHPQYAMTPSYLQSDAEHAQLLEKSISEYLISFKNIREYIRNNIRELTWHQLFILTHLDSTVHWEEDQARKNTFFLLGPVHPMVVAKRFMVQKALVGRAQRLVNENDRKFISLTSLLANLQGFYWQPGLHPVDTSLEASYISSTSDPGWHVGFSAKVLNSLSVTDDDSILDRIMGSIYQSFGLEINLHSPSRAEMVNTVAGSYIRSFPAKRHLGVFFPKGFEGSSEILVADQFIHAENGPSEIGVQLPGGMSLSFEDRPNLPERVRWSDPPLSLFVFDSRDEAIENQNPDIQFVQSGKDLSISELPDWGDENLIIGDLPRGNGEESVFAQPLSLVMEGQEAIPQSFINTWEGLSDNNLEESHSIGSLFADLCAYTCQMFRHSKGLISTTNLPTSLKTVWTVIPGAISDPAVFVRYVLDSQISEIESRALWDYRVDFANRSTSYFVLSTIPAAFENAINGVFSSADDYARHFVNELGAIGLAIAGEAMKSGKHALGVIGVVGAVRLFLGEQENRGAFRGLVNQKAFLIPVDSFKTLLESQVDRQSNAGSDFGGRRADLLAVVIDVPEDTNELLRIRAAAIECKYSSSTLSDGYAQDAIIQAKATTQQFYELGRTALKSNGIPEKLAFLNLIRFGLRIISKGETSIPNLQTERLIYAQILKGNYVMEPAGVDALLVSTEIEFQGGAEITSISKSMWYRLNNDNWPGINDSRGIERIIEDIKSKFHLHSTAEEKHATTTIVTQEEEETKPVISDDAGVKEKEEKKDTIPDSEVKPNGTNPIEFDTSKGKLLGRIEIGVDTGRNSVYFEPHSPVNRLDNANVMITGSSGKGKTQMLKYLITAIRDSEANIIILDFKNDFVGDSHFIERASLESIIVTFDGLPFNPLIPYGIVDPRDNSLYIQAAKHISGVASVIKRTYKLGPQQEASVKKAIRDAFNEYNIDPTGMVPLDQIKEYPDLNRVGEILLTQNATAYSKLDPLFELGLFKEEYRNTAFESLVNRSTAIDFSREPSDELKGALSQLLILSAHSYYNSKQHSGSLRQVFVIDEAHRVLKADFLEKFAVECRAYGVSLFLSSQYPAHFPSEVSAAMATKIIHGNDRDSELVKNIVNLLGCSGQENIVADLGMFEAIFSNKHYNNMKVRTLSYPLFLVISELKKRGELSLGEIESIEGVDTDKLAVGNIVSNLERLGACKLIDNKIILIQKD